MILRTLFFLLILLPVSQAQAAAVITLTATTPENATGGYLPGTVVGFDVAITQDTASAIQVRLAQLDFAASDSMLTFLGDFNFDFSTLMSNALYATFPAYPVPATIYTGATPLPGFMLEIPPAGAALRLGSGQVQLPATAGVFMLDALNAGASDPTNRGAQIKFDFINPTTWSATNGLITGSPLAFTVVPIPSAIWLFGSGLIGLIGIARRKKA